MSGTTTNTGGSAKQQKTGKTGADAPATDPFWEPLIQNASGLYKMTREDLLDDLRKEREEAIKSPDGYKDFKPFVLYGDEAFKKICSAFNYDPKAIPGTAYQFDFHPADLVEAIAILAEGLAKKDFYFINKVFKGLQERCDKLFNVKQKDEDSEEAKSERKERIKAYITLFICALKALVVVDKVHRAYRDAAEKPDLAEGAKEKQTAADVREKVEKGEAVKIVFEWLADLVEAIWTLAWNPKDAHRLGEWAGQFKDGQARLDKSKKDLDDAWKKAGVDKKTKAGGKPAVDPGMKAGTIQKWVAIIKGIGEVLSALVAIRVAWGEMHPKDIDGTWKVEGLPDGHVLWSLEIEQESKNAFSGKLKGHGRVHPDDRQVRIADWADEEKASVEISRKGPSSPKLSFKWKPSVSKKKKFPAVGDGFFYGSDELEDEFDLVSTAHLSCASSGIGQKRGEKKAVGLSRSPQDLSHYFQLTVTVLKLVGALWSVAPERLRNKLLTSALKKAQPVLEPIMARIRKISKSLLSDVQISISPKDPNASDPSYLINVVLSTGNRRFKLTAGWEILPLLNAAAELLSKEPPKEKKSALLPYSLSVKGSYREWGEITVAAKSWDGAVSDKQAGAKLDTLVQFLGGLDTRESFDKWFQGKGLHPDVNMPRVRTGNVGSIESGAIDELLPALEMAVDLYVEDLLDFGEPAGPSGGALPAKLTFTFGLTSAAIASKIPQIRAVLFAWDVGWTIGSFINELPPVQRATTRAVNWLADWANYKDIDDRVDQLFDSAYRYSTQGVIAGMDLSIVNIKSPLFAAEEWSSKHGFQNLFREGRHPKFQRWQEERAKREAEAREHLAAGSAPTRYCWSPGHAMLMAYALGSEAWTAEKIAKQIDDDTKKKALHPMQKDLLAFYLMPFDETTFAANYKKMNADFLAAHQAEFDQARDTLSAAKDKNALPAKEVLVTRWYELVAGNQHRDLVACMLYQAREPERKDEIKILKAPDGYRWEVFRARANENLKVSFFDLNAGTAITRLSVDKRRDALLAHCEFHHASGLLAPFAEELKKFRARVNIANAERIGTYVTIEVQGHGTSQNGLWFLELDDGGIVVNAIDRN